MINQDFLKQLTVLYVEDDPSINDRMTHILKSLFKESISCSDGQQGLETFRYSLESHKKIDVIISDINMPNMDGIEMLKEIRKIDSDVPFIFTTAYSDAKYTMEAIKYGVSHYAIKPINTKELLVHIQEICDRKYQQRLIEHSKIELERYVDVVNQVAIISKTDPRGVITFVNDIFCEVAKYSREELIGANQNIVRHPDMPAIAFESMWHDIKKGLSWKGKVKNKAKDGEAYFVNATIFPVYDSYNEKIIEYVGIRFLTTEEEVEKREFKKKVMNLYQESQRRDFNSRAKIDELESRLKKYEHFDLIEKNLEKEREKTDTLKGQIQHYENKSKEQKEHYETLLKKVHQNSKDTHTRVEEMEKQNKKLLAENEEINERVKEAQEKVKALNLREIEQSRTIKNLREVIKFQEENAKK